MEIKEKINCVVDLANEIADIMESTSNNSDACILRLDISRGKSRIQVYDDVAFAQLFPQHDVKSFGYRDEHFLSVEIDGVEIMALGRQKPLV